MPNIGTVSKGKRQRKEPIPESALQGFKYFKVLSPILRHTLWTGRKPTKRTFEMLCHYFMGWADDEELFDHIEKLKQADKEEKHLSV